MKTNFDKSESHVPLETIQAAISGEIEAIQTIVRHYDPYFEKLASKRLFDEDGNMYRMIDEDLKQQLNINLIKTLHRFIIPSELTD